MISKEKVTSIVTATFKNVRKVRRELNIGRVC